MIKLIIHASEDIQSGIGIKNEIGIMEPFEHTQNLIKGETPALIKELDEPYEPV